MREVFFAGCNGFGTIYLMRGCVNDADVFAGPLLILPYTRNEFLGLDIVANGPYYKVAQQQIGTHRIELGNDNTNKSVCIKGFVGETRAEACSKLSTALGDTHQ